MSCTHASTLGRFAVAAVAASLLAACARQAPVVADVVLLNGKVFTAEPAAPLASAIAIGGDRILAVGSNAEIEALAGGTTRRIDLRGRVVTPGFNDAHIHFSPNRKGVALQLTPMEPSWDEVRRAILVAVTQAPAGAWIFGEVGSAVVLDESVNRFSLDRLAPNHPVRLSAFYGHGSIVNSKAMPLLAIGETEPDPVGGSFERIAGSRRVNGRFWEYAEWTPARALANEASDADAVAQLRALGQEAVGYGVTTLQMFSTLPIDRFLKLLEAADLPVRVHARPFPLTSPQGRDLSEIRQLESLKPAHSRIRVGGIKWILDGTPFEWGAALRQPYRDRPDSRGRLNFPEADVGLIVKESLDFNQPLLVHCAGDRCAEAVFDSMEEAGGGTMDWGAKRVRIEHADGVTADLLARARQLGVVVVLNPTHFGFAEMMASRYAAQTPVMPFRSFNDANVRVAIGSDGPMNPFLNIMLATIHPARPPEAVTRDAAIRAYTSGSAFAEFAERDKGTLARGKLADLAVLSQDIFSVAPPDLPKVRSVLTIVGGAIVHEPEPLR